MLADFQTCISVPLDLKCFSRRQNTKYKILLFQRDISASKKVFSISTASNILLIRQKHDRRATLHRELYQIETETKL